MSERESDDGAVEGGSKRCRGGSPANVVPLNGSELRAVAAKIHRKLSTTYPDAQIDFLSEDFVLSNIHTVTVVGLAQQGNDASESMSSFNGSNMAMKIYLSFSKSTPHTTYVSAAKALYAFHVLQNGAAPGQQQLKVSTMNDNVLKINEAPGALSDAKERPVLMSSSMTAGGSSGMQASTSNPSTQVQESRKRGRALDVDDKDAWFNELFAALDSSYEKRMKAHIDKAVKAFVEKCLDERVVRMKQALDDLGANVADKLKKEANIMLTLEGKMGMFLDGVRKEQVETMTYFFQKYFDPATTTTTTTTNRDPTTTQSSHCSPAHQQHHQHLSVKSNLDG